MKNPIYKKIRTHTLVMGVVTAMVFTVLIAAGLFVTRKTMVSAGNRLGDSAATDARRILIEQAENELSRLAQSKAAVSDEKLAATAEYIRIISQIATNIKSNPAQYGRREISFPDTANTEGKVTVMVQIPNVNTDVNTLRGEIGLMANIQDVLLAIQINNANVGTTYVGTEYGVTVCADPDSAQKTPYFDPRTRMWYINAKRANGLIWTDVFEDYLGRGLAITCAKPFYDAGGRIAGVAGMGTFLNVLSAEVVGTRIGESGYAFIINQKGEMIISDSIKKDEDGRIIRENILESSTFPRETALKMINGKNGIEHIIMDGKEKLIAYHGLATVPWSLAIIINADEVISPALMLENNIITLKQLTLATFNGDIRLVAVLAGIILIFIIAGVMFFSGRLARNITDPIQKLTSDAVLIGTGNLEHILEIKTGDELEILADSFNAMIAGIKTITAEKERLEIASVKKAREAEIIQEANQNLQTILNMLPVGVRIMSMDGSLLFANQALLDVFNCTSEEQVLGHNGYEFMPEIQPDGRKTTDVVAEFFREESSAVEIQCVKLNGEPFIARIHSITTNYKSTRASLAVIEDTTAEKEYQEKLRNIALQEQEANQLKSRFLATMSHEIRTPLNVIIGIMEIQLQNDDNPPDTKDAFEKIYESGSLLLNIINDILDFSKITEGKMEIVPFRYDIPSLINDTAQLNYLRGESKPIKFIVSVDPDTPLEMAGDGLRVKQILNNLLSNAFKYTDKGEIEMSVFSESAAVSSEDVIIVFRIRDTGQGISPEHIGRLFEEYIRFNHDINRTVMGTGLGLSITKRLVNLMNGEIAVESQPGKGSVFTVRLPQKRVGEAVCGAENVRRLREFDFHSTAMVKKTHIVREYMPYGSVLVVDDVKSNLFVAKGLLAPYGLQIDAVDSGVEAVEKIKSGNIYDIIFMDHMMPVMDGIEATRIMRGAGYNRPIVALTANALVGQAEMFMQNGFDAFIPKPIDSRKLNAVLNDFIRDRKPPEIVEAARREGAKKDVKGKGTAEKKRKLSDLEKYFLIDAEASVKKLEEIYANINAPGEEDREAYKITVHGMKSALANIGETGLCETARSLEQAAIEKNTAVMSEKTPAFIGALKSLIEKLASVKDLSDAQISGEDTAYLREKLLEVKTACEAIDKKAAKEAMNDLKQKEWSRRIHDALDEISVHLLHSDFEKASAKAAVVIAEDTERTL